MHVNNALDRTVVLRRRRLAHSTGWFLIALLSTGVMVNMFWIYAAASAHRLSGSDLAELITVIGHGVGTRSFEGFEVAIILHAVYASYYFMFLCSIIAIKVSLVARTRFEALLWAQIDGFRSKVQSAGAATGSSSREREAR